MTIIIIDCMNAQIQLSSGSPQPTGTVQSGSDEQPVQQNFCIQEIVDDILASVKLLNCKYDLSITKPLITNSNKKLTTTGSESSIVVDSLGLSFEELLYLRQSTECNDDFAQLLHEKGVNSKPLRDKPLSVIKIS